MKVILVGSTGTLGKKVLQQLESAGHRVLTVNRSSGDAQLDMQSAEAVEAFFKKVGAFDALIATSGTAKWGNIGALSGQDYMLGLQSKLMGQVNLVHIGRKYAAEKAVFVLTSGVLAQYPMEGSSSLTMINSAIEGYARAVSLELDQQKIQVVSPGWVKETMEMMGMDSSEGTAASEVATYYLKALTVEESGTVLQVVG
ncbi:short chain dehydrogenase [Persicobacter psychrovividus]|uniref:Short chain dehydrogenase n=1 Tax=Persicobacter psychrovividus TaxID=387638 RepID=A0ABM7VJC0_9BACT|nr:short chain dehydrogenase [Persicobacter psychrovividus]